MNAIIEPEPVWQVGAALGEGPLWFAAEQVLRFVDIKGGRLHTWDPAAAAGTTLELGGNPSFIVPEAGGGMLVGSRNALHRMESGKLGKVLALIPETPQNRTNDATIDAAGRLWFGTMDDNERERTGAIWCWDGERLAAAGPMAVVTNGPAVSLGGKWIYHVDSGERTIWRHPLTPAARLDPGEVFIRIDPADGFPDGITVDADDCLWVALWDGWCVRRYSPDGRMLLQVELPCARVTKLAFGGPDLHTAFVTTARCGLSAEDLARQPLAGSLFAFAVSVPGNPVAEVRKGRQA